MPNEIFNPQFLDIFNYMFEFNYAAKMICDDGSLVLLSNDLLQKMVEENRYDGIMVVFERDISNK
jgi:hypothetical protein